MRRAWRRPATEVEVDQKMALLAKLRPQCEDLQEALVEVLATVLASPKFLYLVRDGEAGQEGIPDYELASRLSFFLWSSQPDAKLLRLAKQGRLRNPKVLERQA